MTTIIGIAGSLRKASFNAALLRAAAERVPEGTKLEIASIADFPLYNGDLESESGTPAPVLALKDRIAAADGLLLASPEYNNSVPGVLKNAIDWLSRPPKDAGRVFGEKAVAVMGASPGAGGTRLGTAAWLPILRILGTRYYSNTPLYVTKVGDSFDASGKLIDPKLEEHLRAFITGFVAFAAKK